MLIAHYQCCPYWLLRTSCSWWNLYFFDQSILKLFECYHDWNDVYCKLDHKVIRKHTCIWMYMLIIGHDIVIDFITMGQGRRSWTCNSSGCQQFCLCRSYTCTSLHDTWWRSGQRKHPLWWRDWWPTELCNVRCKQHQCHDLLWSRLDLQQCGWGLHHR